jgi:hypothetical protein
MRRAPVPKFVREAVARLRKKLPAQHPVKVRTGKPLSLLSAAECRFERKRFTIVLDPAELGTDRDWLEMLAHEWAHTLVWQAPSKGDHDDAWGVFYARCYCVVFQTR